MIKRESTKLYRVTKQKENKHLLNVKTVNTRKCCEDTFNYQKRKE